MEKSTKYLDSVRESLNIMDWAELKNKASKNFGIKLTRDHTREQVIEAVMQVIAKQNFAETDDGDLQPGWAEITITPIAGKVTFPVYTNTNGYECYIPIGVKVRVPIKVIETLNNAMEMKKVQNEFGEYMDSLQPSYPFQVHASLPGKDPRPGFEVAREIKLRPYIAFQKQRGYWPSKKVLEAATASSSPFNMYADRNNEAADEE